MNLRNLENRLDARDGESAWDLELAIYALAVIITAMCIWWW